MEGPTAQLRRVSFNFSDHSFDTRSEGYREDAIMSREVDVCNDEAAHLVPGTRGQ